ncbi:MAG TPA: heparinase II/III family protein [Sedimentisphaerales bacterium]|nr:heparinase II/III family protein [Sedimentisphaerales bacterium]HQI28814.1 heparinase II/III family protein [Sedimentisphaerales bacterium]
MQVHADKRATVVALLLVSSFLTAPAVGQGRFKLRELYPQEEVAKVLIPRQQWRPWPTWSDRRAWENLPESVRKDLIANGEQYLKYQWPSLPATLFLEFAREGNRSRYEREHFARRYALTNLVIAECVEGKGRFLDDIANGVWALCEESFWGVPAHVGAQKAGSGLPDSSEPIVDLFAAETGESLAWTYYLLGERLDKISPLIRKRIRLEMDRRILTPCLTRDDFGWMGFAGGRVNNWNPWCNASWLACTLLVESDADRRIASVAKIVRSLDHFLDAYADDGGCDEGPGYWGRAGASLFDCLELLHSATNGAINVYDRSLIQEIGRYIYRVHIADEYFVNFADASARAHPPAELVHRYGKRIGDDRLAAFGAYLNSRIPEGFVDARNYSIGRYLAEVFHAGELKTAHAQAPLPRDVWLDGIQVMTARCRDGISDGFFVAAKGGHNAESHNHNDVGNFIVYMNGRPILIDIGVETYSRKTFSGQRYEIWTMQSAWHNLPTIDGVMQNPGGQFAARDVRYEADDDHAQLTLDIAGAYPKEAGLKSWVRTVRLDRSRDIVVTEQYALEKPAGSITLSLVTPCKVSVAGSSRVLLETADGAEPPVVMRVVYDGSKLTPTVETVPIEDGRLRSVWPERLTRILLKAEKPAMQDTWTVRIERAKNQ